MLKILWKRGKIAPKEQFLPLSTIFYYLMLDFLVKTGIRFSFREKRLFEITEVEITRVDCSFLFAMHYYMILNHRKHQTNEKQTQYCVNLLILRMHYDIQSNLS